MVIPNWNIIGKDISNKIPRPVGKVNQHWNIFGISLDILGNDTAIVEMYW